MTIVLNGTSGAQIPLGTAAAPSATNTTAQATGLYFPSSTTLGLSTNGTAALTIDASQNVGIGTASPANKLHVVGPQGAVASFPTLLNQTFTILENNFHARVAGVVPTSAGYEFGTYAYGSGDTNPRAGISMVPQTSYISFSTGSGSTAISERMRIDSSGNVGIGTASPIAKLDIRGVTYSQPNSPTPSSGVGSFGYYTAGSYGGGIGIVDGVNAWGLWDQSGTLYIGNATSGGSAGALTGRVFIDSSGNVGIGTSSPVCALNISNANGSVDDNYNMVQATYTGTGLSNAGYTGKNYYGTAQFMAWNNFGVRFGSRIVTNGGAGVVSFTYGNDNEGMRLDGSGNLLVGTTSTTPTNTSVQLKSGSVTANGYAGHNGTAGSTWGNAFNIYWTGSAAQLWIDSSNVGNISLTSDYRIKKNVETQTSTALDRIIQLRPVTYTYADNEQFSWKADGVQREGFIAHELQEVIPSAVNGEKNAENQVQSLQLDALCSVLVKAIQELSAKVDAQAAEIAALKGAK